MTDESDRGGLIHLYYGPGKGKTTAAMGSVVRALGHGWSVSIVQFMKGHDEVGEPYGEVAFLEAHDGVAIQQFSTTHALTPDDLSTDERATLRAGFETATEIVSDPERDLVVLDELTLLGELAVIEDDRFVDLFEAKKPGTELLVTGREAPSVVVDAADYVTYMGAVKHPYRRGIEATRGIEF